MGRWKLDILYRNIDILISGIGSSISRDPETLIHGKGAYTERSGYRDIGADPSLSTRRRRVRR
eukprot:5433448-Pyramimonas_sp.AAC.1